MGLIVGGALALMIVALVLIIVGMNGQNSTPSPKNDDAVVFQPRPEKKPEPNQTLDPKEPARKDSALPGQGKKEDPKVGQDTPKKSDPEKIADPGRKELKLPDPKQFSTPPNEFKDKPEPKTVGVTPPKDPKETGPAKPKVQVSFILDNFGNPVDNRVALAQEGEFAGKRLLLWTGEPEVRDFIFTADNPLWKAFQSKGFVVKYEFGKFQPRWLENADQLWIFAGKQPNTIDEEGYKAVVKWVKSGKGLYLGADNDPYVIEAAALAKRLYNTSVSGNYLGTKIGAVRGRNVKREDVAKFTAKIDPTIKQGGGFEINDHALVTGINFLYEGITISHVKPCNYLSTAVLASDGKILLAVSRVPGQRVVIDCGWTRYYYGNSENMRFITRTAGTPRLAENIAAYLMGKTRGK